ncbi:MAG: NTE family protein [Gammaproteobacteria bacterium]|jgi:NTE family protein
MHAHFCLTTRFLQACVQLSCVVMLLFPAHPMAQQVPDDNADRPRIGLVLSGGGARGAAHIGVLKVLEALRVPIDIIVGTSMGAVVGGVYASGMSVAEMETRLSSIKSEDILSDDIPRPDQSERRKRDDIANFIGPEFGVKNYELHLPKGAVAGISLEALLRNLVQHSGNIDFDTLPVPFRAVATDIVNGQMYVLDSGDLVSALRASMSIPGLFAPKELDGHMLVDGGLVRNLPIDVARLAGVDIVIAVNLGTPLLEREQVISLLDVSSQVTKIFTEKNVQISLDSLTRKDILISPELGNFGFRDFDYMSGIISQGETAALLVANSLQNLALSPRAYALHRAGQQSALKARAKAIDEIRFTGLRRVNAEVLQTQLATQVGKPLDKTALDADLGRIFAQGDFSHVDYQLKYESGKHILFIEIKEKPSGPDYLRFGLNLSNDFSGNAHFLALASHRKTWINNLGAEWRNDLKVGRINQITSEFYQPLNVSQSLFIEPIIDLEQRPFEIYDGNNRIARFIRQTASFTLNVGMEIPTIGELRVGPFSGSSSFTVDTGPADLLTVDNAIDIGGTRLSLGLDRLDSGQFPRSGYSYFFELLNSDPSLGARDKYTRWQADFLTAFSQGDHTLRFALHAGGHLGNSPLPDYDLFQLGGFLNLSGFQTGQLLGQSVTFSRLVYANRITRLTLLQGFFGGISLETGKVGEPLIANSPTGRLTAGSVFIATDTPIGPAYLGLGQAKGGNTAMYLYLGIPL